MYNIISKSLAIIQFIIFNVLFTTSYALTISSAEQQMPRFYQQPSFTKLISITSDLSNSQASAYNILLVFTAMALDKHPDYAKQIVKDFTNYSANEKALLFSALIAAQNTNAVQAIQAGYTYTPTTKPNFTTAMIKTMPITNPKIIDALWVAYYATGDDRYLVTLLKYINTDRFALVTAHEFLNRNNLCRAMEKANIQKGCDEHFFDDMKVSVKQHYPNENSDRKFYKIIVLSSAIWSLESNRKQDKTIDAKVDAMIKADPSLDYWVEWRKVIASEKPIKQ